MFLFTALLLGSNFLINVNHRSSGRSVYAEEQTTLSLPEIGSEAELNYDDHYEDLVVFIIYMEEFDPNSPDIATAERWIQIIEEKTQIEVNEKMQAVFNRTNLELPLSVNSITLDDKTLVYDIYGEIDYLLKNRQTFVNNSYLLSGFNASKNFVVKCKNKIDKIETDMAYAEANMQFLDEKMPAIMQRDSFDESEEQELRDLYLISINLTTDYQNYLTTEEIEKASEYKYFLQDALKAFIPTVPSNLAPLSIYLIGAICFLSLVVFVILTLKKLPNSTYEVSEIPTLKRRDLVGRYRLTQNTEKQEKDNKK